MTSSHAIGHFSVALYRITRQRQAPGGSVAGNGLLMSFQCGFFRLNATLVTSSAHSPILQIEIVRSARQHAFTPPKHSEPVTTSRPAGASPLTFTVCGLPGSLLVTVIVPAAGPKPVGAKRIGSASESPGPITSGKDSTSGAWNGAVAVIANTVTGQWPLLLSTSGLSANRPTQTLPKLPLSAIAMLRRGAGASPRTRTICGEAGSLLKMVIVPAFSPSASGAKRIGMSIESPTPSLIG